MRTFRINEAEIRVSRSHLGLDVTVTVPEGRLRRMLRDLEQVKRRLALVPGIGPMLRVVTDVELQVLEELREACPPAPEARH
jgi:hypothetical protein